MYKRIALAILMTTALPLLGSERQIKEAPETGCFGCKAFLSLVVEACNPRLWDENIWNTKK